MMYERYATPPMVVRSNERPMSFPHLIPPFFVFATSGSGTGVCCAALDLVVCEKPLSCAVSVLVLLAELNLGILLRGRAAALVMPIRPRRIACVEKDIVMSTVESW